MVGPCDTRCGTVKHCRYNVKWLYGSSFFFFLFFSTPPPLIFLNVALVVFVGPVIHSSSGDD